MNNEIVKDFDEIKYLNSSDFKLKKTEGGFVSMKLKEENEFKIVSFYKCFPLSSEYEFISIQNEKDEEIGIIKNLNEMPYSLKSLIIYDLNIRYFMPKIIEILKIKDELGYYYWEVKTDSGFRMFTTKAGEENIKIIKNNMLVVEDIDGNRYGYLNFQEIKGKYAKMLTSIL